MNNFKNKKTFFFFIDSLKELENNNYFKVVKYFQDNSLICNNKFFSVFSNDKIDFNFLEKNDKLISFFYSITNFFLKTK